MEYHLLQLFVLIIFNQIYVKCEIMKWCIDNEYIDEHNTIVERVKCVNRPCVISTCAHGKFQLKGKRKCENMKRYSLDFSKFLTVYKMKSGKVASNNFSDSFQVVSYKDKAVYQHNNCTTKFYQIEIHVDGYFLENGSFLLITKDKTEKVVPAGEYIVKFSARNVNGNMIPELQLKFAKDMEVENKCQGASNLDNIYSYVMLVSCFFMILVVVVNVTVLRRELRTSAGMIFLAYVSNLTIAFFLSAFRNLGISYSLITSKHCYILSTLHHFFVFSSYTWMDIVGFDIWWTLWKVLNNRHISHGKTKFILYCCIGWLPWVVYVGCEMYLERFAPHIYDPRFYYCTALTSIWHLAAPVLPLQIANLTLLVLTIVNLRRIMKVCKSLNNADSVRTSPRNNAYLSIKILIATGSNWVLDLLLLLFGCSFPNWLQIAINMSSALNGVLLFFVFIFRYDVMLKVFRRYITASSTFLAELHYVVN